MPSGLPHHESPSASQSRSARPRTKSWALTFRSPQRASQFWTSRKEPSWSGIGPMLAKRFKWVIELCLSMRPNPASFWPPCPSLARSTSSSGEGRLTRIRECFPEPRLNVWPLLLSTRACQVQVMFVEFAWRNGMKKRRRLNFSVAITSILHAEESGCRTEARCAHSASGRQTARPTRDSRGELPAAAPDPRTSRMMKILMWNTTTLLRFKQCALQRRT
mmetsp:Transcript_63093/g.133202  ORF Transcript_63093/g.133202 Transcript_63093/m.133202 type:complete len:219 (+) Transcript_63093:472-1128(+)